MIVSDQRPPGEDWLVRRVVDLERQVRELQAGRRLEAATIGAGGLTVNGGSIRVLDGAGGSVELAAGALRVLDTAGNVIVELGKMVDGRYGWRVNNATGDPQVRAGELAGGGYGLEAVNAAGEIVSLSTLAFGVVAAHVAASESTASAAYTDLTTVGPAVTTIIGSTGRCLVFMSGTLNPTVGDGAKMSVAVSGATTRAADDVNTLPYGSRNGTTDQVVIEACRGTLLTGLNPGSTTFTAKYRSTFGATVTIAQRTLIAIPF